MPTGKSSCKRIRFDLTEQSLECQLRFAAKYGSLHKITQLVTTRHADINAPNCSSQTPLIIAIMNKKLDSIHLLCQLGANVNFTTDKVHGYCPLHFAAEHDNGQIIQMLIMYGAMLNEKTFTGCTALHLAAMNGNVEAVRWLCLNGADVNVSEHYNSYTPLHYAMVRGHHNIVHLLLEFEARLSNNNFPNASLKGMCNKALWKYLDTMETKPRSLEELCLQIIRSNFLPPNANRNASCLPLPECLKEKVLLQEYNKN